MNKITVIPNLTSERVETGPIQIGEDDWPGVFIRCDQAWGYAGALKFLLEQIREEKFAIVKGHCEALMELLMSCDMRQLRGDSKIKTIERLGDCLYNRLVELSIVAHKTEVQQARISINALDALLKLAQEAYSFRNYPQHSEGIDLWLGIVFNEPAGSGTGDRA